MYILAVLIVFSAITLKCDFHIHMIKFNPLHSVPCKMNQGIIFLFSFLALSRLIFASNANAKISGWLDDYEFIDINTKKPRTEMTFPISSTIHNPRPTIIPSLLTKEELIVNENADASGLFGLRNHNNICYMSSFISASFHLSRFREAIYACEPSAASHVMLAQVFAKLQNATRAVSTELCLMPAINKDLTWDFGEFECNMEFGSRILDILPASVKSLYNLTIQSNYYLKDNHQLLKTKIATETHVIVPPKYASLSEAIASRFPDHEAEDYIIERKDFHEYAGIIDDFEGEKKSFGIYNETTITNRPEMMVFGIRRRQLNNFDYSPMELDFELVLPGLEDGNKSVKYLLKSFCVHWPSPAHYISYVRDFSRGNSEGDWYLYNDSNASAIRKFTDYERLRSHADTGATLAFYVRADSISDEIAGRVPVIPERIKFLANLMTALEDIKTQKDEISPQSFSRKSYNSPPVTRDLNPSTPESEKVSVDAQFASITKQAVHCSPMMVIEERRVSSLPSENVPSPTHDKFLKYFPLNQNYFAPFADFWVPEA